MKISPNLFPKSNSNGFNSCSQRQNFHRVEITIQRKPTVDGATLGVLAFDGFSCDTLEDAIRDEKIAGETAIPEGRFEIVISYSNRFKKMLPLLMGVPNFEGVRIHAGNTKEHTEGCILLGIQNGDNRIIESRATCNRFMTKLVQVLRREKVFVNIKNPS